VGLLTGIADASFDQCVMRSNVAYMGGGAISFDGTTTTRLLIERSILEENIVHVPPSTERETAAMVGVFTGGLGDGSEDAYGAYHALVWRIDDGPVYGVPFELCEAARQYSLDLTARGFSESWPSDLVCANETYRTQSTYSQVELLTNGEHTLWYGVITQGAQVITTWLKGWIQVV